MRFFVDNTLGNKNVFLLLKDNWNDWFEYRTQYYLCFIDDTGKRNNIGHVKIGQTDMSSEQERPSLPDSFDTLPDNFFSLGQSEYYYENLAHLEDNLREEVLIALRDIAFNLEIHSLVKELNVTNKSIQREVSDFMINNQYHRLAHGSARLTDYWIEYLYPQNNDTLSTKLTFEVTPNSNPPTNIHVIIGRNNVGKTYFIKQFLKSIYIDDKQYGQIKAICPKELDIFSNYNQAFANVLSVSFSTFDDFSELEQQISLNKSMPYRHIGLKNGQRLEEIKKSFSESILTCQKSRHKIKLIENAIKILETDPIFERAQFSGLLKITPDGDRSDANAKEKAEKLFEKLSSGHQVILLTLMRVVEFITERSLIILDEPENHLHPPLLSAFIRALSELLIDRNAVAIIATHSPVILQEVPRSCVWKINRNGNIISVARPDIETFGATIGELTREVFGLEVRKSGFYKLLFDEVHHGLNYEQIIEKYSNQLGDEARALLYTMSTIKE